MNLREAVDHWLPDALMQVASQSFAQVDLDDLLNAEPPHAAATGLECLRVLMQAVSQDVDGLLTIPLAPAESCEWPNPNLDDLLAQEWSYGPGRPVPGLYLIGPSQWRRYEPVEEYRRPVGARKLPTGFVAYYRAWRAADEADYERCVYVRARVNA